MGKKPHYYAYTTYDAHDLTKNTGTDIHVPEWEPGSYNEKIAYNKNQTYRKIKVQFYSSNGFTCDAKIRASKTSGAGLGGVQSMWVPFNGHYSDEVVMTISGSVPGTIGKRYFDWSWKLLGLGDQIYEEEFTIGTSGRHYYYTLLAGPLSPTFEPWTDVLELVCSWASGKSNEADALVEITENAYSHYSETHEYTPLHSHSYYQTFNLTGFLDDDCGDCSDMSALVHIYTYTLGGSNTAVRWIDDPDDEEEEFYYKPVLPFGWSVWTDDDPGLDKWNFHQVVWYNNGVYDPTAKLKKSNPRLVIDESINGSYKTDLFYSGDWVLYSIFFYTGVY